MKGRTAQLVSESLPITAIRVVLKFVEQNAVLLWTTGNYLKLSTV